MSDLALTAGDAQELLQLLDKQKISEAIFRYAHALDRCDPDMFRSVFWEDGCYEGGPGEGPVHAIADTMMYELAPRRFAKSQHLMGNILINLQGAQATSETYALGYHQTNPTAESAEQMLGREMHSRLGGDPSVPYDLVIGLRYLDRWQKRDREWRIASRKLVIDWSTVQRSSEADGGLMDRLSYFGTRGSADAAWGVLD